MVERACLGDVLKEAGEVAFLGIVGVDHSAYVRELNEQLMRLTHFIECVQDT